MSLPACPAPGKCLDLDPRVEALERSYQQIHSDLGEIKRDVAVLKDHREASARQWGHFWTLAVSLLIIGLGNLAGFAWAQGATAERFEALRQDNSRIVRLVEDHEMRIRLEERKQ